MKPSDYDANGYVKVPEFKDMGPNPWAPVAAQTMENVNSGMQTGAANIQNMQSQIGGLGSMDGGYPAMANSFGLGTTPTPGSASNPSFAQNPLATPPGTQSSTGANPWTFTGEALSF